MAQQSAVVAFSAAAHHQQRLTTPRRNLFSSKQQQEEQQKQQTSNKIITTIEKLEDYLDFLAQDDKICVVKFHASWCKSCQKFGVLFRRWASNNNNHSNKNIRLAEVEFGQNTHLCRALSVKKLPLIHIYKGRHGLITSFPCGPNKFEILKQRVERLVSASGSSEEELLEEIERMQQEEGGSFNDHVVTELQKNHFEEALMRNGEESGSKRNGKLAP